MRQREFITGGATAWPLAANGQQVENPISIGFLPLGSPSHMPVEAFRHGLPKIGAVENRVIQ
jgi:hypothetical protein